MGRMIGLRDGRVRIGCSPARPVGNDLKIVEHAEHCLVYDQPLAPAGLTSQQLIAWWAGSDQLAPGAERDAARNLYYRLLACMPVVSRR
jgi:hypothetical protein